MTACDLGAITKPWEIQKKVAKKIEDEFYFQVCQSNYFFLDQNHICSLYQLTIITHLFLGWLGEDWVEWCAKCNDGSPEKRRVSFTSGDAKNETKAGNQIFFSLQVGYVDFICEPLYEHLVHQEHLEYLRQLEAKETNNIDNNGPIWTSLDPMLEGRVRMSFSWFPAPKKPRNGFN